MQKNAKKMPLKYAAEKYAKICNDLTNMDLKRKYVKIRKQCAKYAKYVGMKLICKIFRNLHSPLSY